MGYMILRQMNRSVFQRLTANGGLHSPPFSFNRIHIRWASTNTAPPHKPGTPRPPTHSGTPEEKSSPLSSLLGEQSAPFKWNSATSWKDMLLFEGELTQEESMLQATAHRVAQNELLPLVTKHFIDGKTSRDPLLSMADGGLLSPAVHNMTSCGYGLVAREIEKVDSGYRSMFSVQSSLVILPLTNYGSDEQKEKYLPRLSTGEMVGCFALTEPEAGSDVKSLKTTAVLKNGYYHLNGNKMWISNAPLAQVALVWAKVMSEDALKRPVSSISCFVVDTDLPGVAINPLQTANKMSLRTSPTGEITLSDVKVPESALLPHVPTGAKGAFTCLNNARLGIAWGVLGAAEACVEIAHEHALNRYQFGRPIGSTQLVQIKLVDAVTEISLGLQGTLRASQMKDKGVLHPNVISMLKRNNTTKARNIIRDCRDILGASGIIADTHVIRHMLNLEAVHTYEGTADIHGLVMGKAITGINAV
eukprot:GHVN01086123.1.p1 GENE.GHVN01086123.1~~GHVN01086123.1.p1  ORF type:complete len:475 (+),score=85.10 GHVN01086123.1:20-1444(+)